MARRVDRSRTKKARLARRLLLVLLLLCSGLILNIAVAWVCSKWSMEHLGFGWSVPVETPAHWPAYLEELDWPAPIHAERTNGIIFSRVITWGSPWRGSGVPPRGTLDVSQDVLEYGLPARSLLIESHGISGASSVGKNAYQMALDARNAAGRRAGVDLKTGKLAAAPFGRSEWRVPIVPVWPGFAINTVFYAAFLWLLPVAFRWRRRRSRIRRGRCPTCKYPFGSSDVCTECSCAIESQWRQSAKAPNSATNA